MNRHTQSGSHLALVTDDFPEMMVASYIEVTGNSASNQRKEMSVPKGIECTSIVGEFANIDHKYARRNNVKGAPEKGKPNSARKQTIHVNNSGELIISNTTKCSHDCFHIPVGVATPISSLKQNDTTLSIEDLFALHIIEECDSNDDIDDEVTMHKIPTMFKANINKTPINNKVTDDITESSRKKFDKEFDCQLCHQNFEDNKTFVHHLELHYKAHLNKLTCKYPNCGKVFSTNKLLAHHARIHKKEIVCNFNGCGKIFNTLVNLKRHARIHTEMKLYFCEWPQCEKNFVEMSSLTRHMRIHLEKQEELEIETK